eukprot:scaffold7116_cov296-Pinguiococcus_pyrenoidosus.AAC.10
MILDFLAFASVDRGPLSPACTGSCAVLPMTLDRIGSDTCAWSTEATHRIAIQNTSLFTYHKGTAGLAGRGFDGEVVTGVSPVEIFPAAST